MNKRRLIMNIEIFKQLNNAYIKEMEESSEEENYDHIELCILLMQLELLNLNEDIKKIRLIENSLNKEEGNEKKSKQKI